MLFLLVISGLIFAAPAPLAVSPGSSALAFELPALNPLVARKAVGKSTVALGDLSGVLPSRPQKAIVLHFFDLEEKDESLKALDKLQQRYKVKEVQVLGICSRGTQSSLASKLQKQAVRFPVLFDGHQIVTSRYGVTKLPMTIIVDGTGRVFAIGQPPVATLENELSAELDGLLSSATSPQP